MLRLVPPAGMRVALVDIRRAMQHAGDQHTEETALSRVSARVGANFAFGARSGRAALYYILRAGTKLRPDKRVVAVPGYTCFSVAAAVVRAGLKILPLDLDPDSLDIRNDELAALSKHRDLLCVLSASLFGFVNDVGPLRQAAEMSGAFLVDDAAQAFGASRAGTMAGLGGDIGFYSLGRGKALAAAGGGVIVSNNSKLASAVKAEIDSDDCNGYATTVQAATVLATSVFLQPSLYWFPDALPFLKLGVTDFNPDFAVAPMAPFQAALLSETLEKVDTANARRRARATTMLQALSGLESFRCPRPAPDCTATYIRFPVLAKNASMRDEAVRRLRRAGISATAYYPSAICDIPGIGEHLSGNASHCRMSEALAQTLLTLPTHELVGDSDVERMAAVLADVENNS